MYKQGDIIEVWFPFSDFPMKGKIRPAIIISNELSNAIDNDVLVAPITSKIRENEFSFLLQDEYLTISLPKNSEIRCNKMATIRISNIISKFSFLKEERQSELIDRIYKSIKK
ncbi:MAG: type II toxin-antitoxin system PemK/MazF family toxin [Cytophagales bacterium]